MADKKEEAKKDDELKKEILDIYTPLSVAKKEIWQRWKDEKLKKKIKEAHGKIPNLFKKEPRAVLLRYIATPNFEAKNFFDLAYEIKLKPLYGEFLEDKFCTSNQDKLHLATMTFFHGLNKHGKINTTKKKLIDIKKNDGKLLCNINTLWGDKLTNFHHKIFCKHYPNIETFDAYTLRASDKDVIDFYEKIFIVCLCYGVLFENFITKDNHYENKFTSQIILPAYKKVFQKYGLKPLVSPISSIDDEDSKDWMWYPGQLEKEMEDVV